MARTQIDALFQIKNLPPFTITVNDVPHTFGPFTGAVLLVDRASGIGVVSGPMLRLLPASLTQQGVIGTTGGQSLRGPLFFHAPFQNTVPPFTSFNAMGLVLVDGMLAFYNANDGPVSSPNAFLQYVNPTFGIPILQLQSNTNIKINTTNSAKSIALVVSGNQASLYLQDTVFGTGITTIQPIRLVSVEGAGQELRLGYDGVRSYLSLRGASPYFTLNPGFLDGQYGTLPDGSVVSGGIITHMGSGGGGGGGGGGPHTAGGFSGGVFGGI